MYQDEVSFKQAGSIYRHWALKGIGCVVKTPPTRKSLKVMGAVTVGNDPKFHFRFVNWFNTKSFLSFLDQLISRYKDQKIYLILDNAKYHKGPEVRKWLNGKQARIELHYLPPYSPDLNPIELAFSKFKKLLRDGAERTVDKLWSLCGSVLDQFTESECRNYFQHCGYRYT